MQLTVSHTFLCSGVPANISTGFLSSSSWPSVVCRKVSHGGLSYEGGDREMG